MLKSSPVKVRAAAVLVSNAAVAVMALIGVVMTVGSHGASALRFYTEDSNIFAMLACFLCAFYAARTLATGKTPPRWLKTVKYMAVCCLTVTLAVVVFVLAPMAGENGFTLLMLRGSSLFHHFLCPAVALLSFIFLEREPSLSRRHALYALLPTAAYAVVTVVLNVARVMTGPYPFLYVYEQPVYMSVIWFVAILGAAYLMARLILLANGGKW